MKFVSHIIASAALIALTGTAVLAEGEAQDPTVKARMELMKSIGGAAKALGGMAGDKVPFDAATAEAAKADLSTAAAQISTAFEAQANDPASEAKAEIWTTWEDFVAKGAALKAAADAMDASSVEGVKAGMGAIGATCKDCHSTYRM